jgi:hypothetical protein
VSTRPVMPPLAIPSDMDLSLLAVAFPAFTITCHPHGWREPRWEAVRAHGADPGLYAVITPDLSELLAILTTATGIQPGGPAPGTGPREPGQAP